MSGEAVGGGGRVRAFRAVPEPVPDVAPGTGGGVRDWTVLGAEDGPVADALRRASRPGGAPGVAVVLGERYRDAYDAVLLDAVARAEAGAGRVVLLHRGAGGASLLRAAARESAGRLRVASAELPADRSAPWPAGWDAGRLAGVADAVGGELRVAGRTGVPAAGAVARLGWQPAALTSRVQSREGPPSRDGTDACQGAGPPGGTGPCGGTAMPCGGTAIVTGGLGGLGLRVASVLAVVHGMRPVLLDVSAPEELAGRDAGVWRRLRDQSGVMALRVDLTDAGATDAALRRVPGPVRAVVHCAGLVAGGPVARTRADDLRELRDAKVGTLRHVLAGIDAEELRHLVVFGSVTARAPHRNMGGYALANEVLRRETLRWAPHLPYAATVVAEWSLWSGAGQAHAMGAVAQARRMGMVPVALRPGMAALSRLLARPAGPGNADALVLVGAGDPLFPPAAVRT
ncbi:hypothetical protein AMK26_31970 [Streptomyces sp. CB03234]|uniref:KR domain-containing protein n=1 Tax=Streptomyces sp. (strain CB03234) TaxID=1703937 RepID=UPI00076F2A89|nr:KR domain-containing protein [Streptomyces sp. CB03234]AME17997.1 ketone reductase [Streptomyces sp. CB03234]OKJ95188.1 hypothetical protein AMK26_31970 [Streptomyces sp. CB03234]